MATLNVHSEGRKATLNARNKRREASRVPGLLRNYINFKGGPMTNEQFRSQLRSLIDPKTTTSVKAISSLFSIATQENLSLLVVLIESELVVIVVLCGSDLCNEEDHQEYTGENEE